MKIEKKLKKVVVGGLVSTMILSTVPTMASDYENHWAKGAIDEWNKYGIVAGYGDDIFKPNNQVTRGELAAFMTRLFGLQDMGDITQFKDVKGTEWYASDVAKVSAAGIMNGSGGEFNPKAYATREEVAATLVKAFKLTGGGDINFNDEGDISPWAKEAVQILVDKGYVNGQPGNKFAPKANITRGEMIQLLDNMVTKVINTEGVYEGDISGNVVINNKGAVIDGINLNGNVYLAPGIGPGDVTIKNTKIVGDVFVSGTDSGLTTFDDVDLTGKVYVESKGTVKLVSKDSDLKVEIKNDEHIVLTGDYSEVLMVAGATAHFSDATTDRLIVIPKEDKKATINIYDDSTVKDLVAQSPIVIQGDGKIEVLTVESNDVKSEIQPEKVEVNKDVNEPELPEKIDEDASSSSSDSGNSEGSGTVTPQINYAQLESMSVVADDYTLYNIPSSVMNINDKNITIDISDLQGLNRELPSTIIGGKIKFNNLSEGDKVSTAVKSEQIGDISITGTVDVDSLVGYEVLDLAKTYDNVKPSIINNLQESGLYEKVENILNGFDISLEADYMVEGYINVETLVTKASAVLSYIDANKDKPSIQGVAEQIEMEFRQHNLNIDLESRTITADITLIAPKLNDAVYSLTINY